MSISSTVMDISESDTVNSDIEEEEILVYTDFDSVLDEGLIKENTLFKVIALDTDEPFLQIGSQMYSGKWLDSVGTNVFFEAETNTQPSSDPVFSDIPNTILNYKCKTRKCLNLSRVFINKKDDQTKELVNSLQKSSISSCSETKANKDVTECNTENSLKTQNNGHSEENTE